MPIGRDRRTGGIFKDDPRRLGLGGGGAGGGASRPTWGTYGARYYRSKNAIIHWVIRITNGSSQWMFSDCAMDLSDGHVYPLLVGDPSKESGIDPITKELSYPDVGIEISNVPYRVDTSGNQVCFGDEAGSLHGALIWIYVLAGKNPTQLADGFPLFEGALNETPTITFQSVSLSATNTPYLKNRILPQNYMTDDQGTPQSLRTRKRSLVYGTFNKAFDNSSDLGLVRCELLSVFSNPKFLVADHPCFEVSNAFVKHEELPHPSILISPTIGTDGSGRPTIVAIGDADAYLYVTGQYQGNSTDGAGLDGACTVEDVEKAGDADHTTYAIIRDAVYGSAVNVHAYFSWADYEPTDSNFLNKIGKIVGFLSAGSYYLGLQWKIVKPDISGTGYISLLNAGGTLVTDRVITSDVDGDTYFTLTTSAWDAKIMWHLLAGRNDNLSSDQPIVAVVKMDTTKSPSTPGREVFRVKYIRLVLRYKPKYIAGPRPLGRWAFYLGRPGYVIPQLGAGIDSVLPVYAEVKGRMFGAWIDADGRSNSYNEGGLIEDPAFIIESLLRDELGFTSDDLDVASFDDAANSSVKARIQISSDNETDALSIIRQLAEQSTFAFAISGVSTIRLINLKTSSPTIMRKLNLSDFGGEINNLKYDKRSRILNDMKIRHRWMSERQDYVAFDNYFDSTSQGKYGILTEAFDWPNITVSLTDSLFEVANFIKGKFATPRVILNIFSPGARNVDLESGDWIEIDSVSVDPLLKCYGESWSGKKFLITNVRNSPGGTTIEAINLI